MPKDYPFTEIMQAMEKLASKGAQCFLKFTCEGCGERLTCDEPNTVYSFGTCPHCGHRTDIAKRGGNYMVVMSNPLSAEFLSGKWQPADECPYRHLHKKGEQA